MNGMKNDAMQGPTLSTLAIRSFYPSIYACIIMCVCWFRMLDAANTGSTAIHLNTLQHTATDAYMDVFVL